MRTEDDTRRDCSCRKKRTIPEISMDVMRMHGVGTKFLQERTHTRFHIGACNAAPMTALGRNVDEDTDDVARRVRPAKLRPLRCILVRGDQRDTVPRRRIGMAILVYDHSHPTPGVWAQDVVIEEKNVHKYSIAVVSLAIRHRYTPPVDSHKPNTIRKLLWLLRRIRFPARYFFIPAALSIVAALFEGIGAWMLIPMLNGFMIKDFSFLKDTPLLSNILIWLPQTVTTRDRDLFVILLGIFMAVIIAKNLFRYAGSTSMAFLASRCMHHLRKQLFNCYLHFGKQYFDQGSLGHHTTAIVQLTQHAFKPLFSLDKLAQTIFSLAAYMVVMVMISWKLTIITIPLFTLMHLVVRKRIEKIRSVSKEIVTSNMDLNKKVVDIFSMIPLVQSFNMQEEERRRFTVLSDKRAVLEFRVTALGHMIQPLQELITMLSIVLLIGSMLYFLVRDDATSAPSFLVYFYLINNVANRFGVFSSFRTEYANATGPVDEIVSIFTEAEKHLIPEGAKVFPGLQRSIEFRNLSFTYTQEVQILRNISLSIQQGKQTAIVGPTGSGKTTIINLLLRYYDCPPGTIFLDGTDIREFTTASLREKIAVVSQDTLLLNESLQENITYGLETVDEELLQDVLRHAKLDTFIAGLPDGLRTTIGDRGMQLSGGERQRVSLARALLKRADILILDEATSALDSQTELLVQEAIAEAIRGKTAIIIAHRLSTIRSADTIVVLEGGKCVEQGALQELLDRKGRFADLWEAQKFS